MMMMRSKAGNPKNIGIVSFSGMGIGYCPGEPGKLMGVNKIGVLAKQKKKKKKKPC
jgi:hypothetical protein